MAPNNRLKDNVCARIDGDRTSLVEFSHEIHAAPELAYEEFRSSELLAAALDANGLKVERKAHGLETAFRASAGRQGPHVAICAEFDALPEIGHACGHNIIGSSAVGAGIALADVADDLGIRVTVLGTPAEEAGGGKVDLIEAGAFDDVDVALMVHPGPMEVVDMPTLAIVQLRVTYHGKESHASAFPELGVNALDALNISYTAISALRQHIKQTDRIHGIVTHGGDAPNIVPKRTSAEYYVRAETLEELEQLEGRVRKCFEAGALATGCEVEIEPRGHAYDRVVMNPTMGEIYDRNLTALGRQAIPRSVVERTAGSTDMGNVSRILPAIHPLMSIDSLPAVNHQAEFTAHCVSRAGDDAVIDAAKAMAMTVVDLATTDGAFEHVAEEFAATR
ncbi:MAG: M20 family metallopeptidase [Actinomycetota bacterium]|nr:M20 family metallopeptidase [Actinomycetota bacterium]